MKYMVGKEFFKTDQREDYQHFNDGDSEYDTEEIPYSVLEEFEVNIRNASVYWETYKSQLTESGCL